MIQDLLFVGLWTDWRSFVWHYGTGHRPGDPRGGNVTAGDGSTFWLALASRTGLPFPGSSGVTFTQDANWFTVDNYLGNSFCVPKAYYSQIAGWGSIELGTAGTSVVGYSPGDANVFSTVANRGLYY